MIKKILERDRIYENNFSILIDLRIKKKYDFYKRLQNN